ncbi:hypothetical protein ACJMK2_020284 [Sinanodonta woodiana]|uniref:Hermansky-Pudlak syndrome 3 protein n=1 Tax=Sinanodonta woodiana TaxID=1069815 RepID=A0ABD3TZN4_SINWO
MSGQGFRGNTYDTLDDRLEVINLPCPEVPRIIASCQETGNFAIAFRNTLMLYHIVDKTIPNSMSTYQDMEIFLEIEFDFTVNRLAICEDYLAVTSRESARVYKIVYSEENSFNKHVFGKSRSRMSSSSISPVVEPNEIKYRRLSNTLFKILPDDHRFGEGNSTKFSAIGERGSHTPSPAQSAKFKYVQNSHIEDDVDFVQWNFEDDQNDFDLEQSFRSSLGQRPDSKTLFLPGLEAVGWDVCITSSSQPVIKDHRGGGHRSVGTISLQEILSERMNISQELYTFVQLIPSYLTSKVETLPNHLSHSLPVYSSRYSTLADVSCFLSGSRSGHMYSLTQNVKLVSTYKYTGDALKMITDGNLLYVVTTSGLQVYTARSRIAAIHNSESFDNITKTIPPSTLEVCLCGNLPFPGARTVTLLDHHLILYSKDIIEKACVWNVYALEKCSTIDLYKDMMEFGSKFQESGPDTYCHILQEGHMILKSNLLDCCEEEAMQMKDLIAESSALLGEYYAMPERTAWRLCLPYYLMSGISPADVVRQSLQYKQHSKKSTPYCYGQGLVYYLNYVLFLDEEPLNLKETESDLILLVWAETKADRLSEVLVCSRLRNYTPEKALELLKTSMRQKTVHDERTRALDALAMCLVYLQMGEPEDAQALLTTIDKEELVQVCISHHQVLHVDFTELSSLSQLMRCHCPDLLIHVLVKLHDQGTILLDLAIKLLQGTSGVPEIHLNTHVSSYLESLVDDVSRKFIFDEAVQLLCEIYIRRLADWKPPSSRQRTASLKHKLPSGNGHFGRRPGWLDFLPPFSGPQSISQPCHFVLIPSGGRRPGIQTKQLQVLECQRSAHNLCPCLLCNEDLLKLQSLLSSSFTSHELIKKVLSLVDQNETNVGGDSIQLLCLVHTDVQQATQTVINKYPAISAMFGLASLGNSFHKWKFLLTCLLDKVKTIQGTQGVSAEEENIFTKVLKDVLNEFAGLFSPVEFLSCLPSDGNFLFFMPYIQVCADKQKMAALRQRIISTGQQIT